VTRVKVFIDYQNVYHGARGAFGQKDDHPNVGHVRPWGLGVLLRQLGEAVDPARTLEQVAIYRGEPTTRSHPLLQAAFQKQVAAWSSLAPKLDVTTRPLRYNATRWDHSGKPIEWDKGEEKGIDVLLALGLVLGAIRDEYDVAVVVSGDTDLVPAIDATLDVGPRTRATAASYGFQADLVPPLDPQALRMGIRPDRLRAPPGQSVEPLGQPALWSDAQQRITESWRPAAPRA
jgi:uncharacterized LabA/DUF88 family protein